MPDPMAGAPSALGFLWRTTSLRHATRGWRHTLTLIAILALGVAAFLSIRMANRAAVNSFAGFSEVVSGGSDLTLTAPAGWLDATLLTEMRAALAGQPAELVPLLRADAALPHPQPHQQPRGAPLAVLGVDLVGIQNLPAAGERLVPLGADSANFWQVLRNPHHLFVSSALAERHKLTVGCRLPLLVNDAVVDFEVVGVLPAVRAGVPVPENLLVTDIAALQALSGQPGRLSQVDVVVAPGARHAERLAAVRGALAAGAAGRWVLREPAVERSAGERMTAAFRMNLTVLSLIALLVGVYLVSQALDAAVVRRRHEIAILRSLGVTDGELRRLWLWEILTLGVAGSALGILLGWGLAQLTVVAVARTMNALYQASSASAASLTWADAAIGFALGTIFSLLAGWLPLRDAAATPPAQVLASGNWSPGLRLLECPRLGALLVALGALCSQLPPLRMDGGARFPLAGFAAALLLLLGGTLLVTGMFVPLARLAVRGSWRWPAWMLGVARLRRASSRHRLAAAGLFVATTMAAAMTILVGSFDRTVRDWIDVRFRADVYVTSAGAQSAAAENRIRAGTWEQLAADPRVAAMDVFLALPIELDGKRTYLAGNTSELIGTRQQLVWLSAAPPPGALAAEPADGVFPAIANEAFTERFGVTIGQTLEVPTPAGPRRLRVIAIDADYGNDQGMLLVDRTRLASWFATGAATNLSVFLHDRAELPALLADWRARFPGLDIRSNRELRDVAISIFEQTFSITHALELIGIFIAIVGLALALTNILRESARELLTMRQLGMTRREMATTTATEGAGIALVGLLGGLLMSLAFGYLLVFVINKQSFGWTLQFSVPVAKLATLSAIILTAGAATAYLTGLRAHRLTTPRGS